MFDLEAERNRREREAQAYREAIHRWLKIGGIATAAVLRAAADGNAICQAAAREILPLLPEVPEGRGGTTERTENTEGKQTI